MRKNKAFTILELLVVVAIIAIIAVIAIPNFIGRIEAAKASQELAEINAVEKAIATYYAENGVYPTLQAKDGTLLQPQPLEGSPHNIDFSDLVPNYLATLPHFSYWWVDYKGNVYHTDKTLGTVSGGVFTPAEDYTYTVYKANGTTQVLSAPYTLQTGDYIVGSDTAGVDLPKISLVFKNAKMHPEDPEYVASIAVTGVSLSKTTSTLAQGNTETLTASVLPSGATNKSVTWTSSNTGVATVSSTGVLTAVASGTSTITVSTVDGSKTATCVVTVPVAFTGATFTNAGATGRTGPTQAQVTSAYSSTVLAGKVTVAGSGIQLWTVPATGTYRVEAYGAQGGAGPTVQGGKGAYIKGDVQLVAGDILNVVVGQAGVSNGGGGGGTFVWKSGADTPLIVAGGGGGSGNSNGVSGAGIYGKDASTTQNGTAGSGTAYGWGAGGTSGNAGAAGATYGTNGLNGSGGGGSGWYQDAKGGFIDSSNNAGKQGGVGGQGGGSAGSFGGGGSAWMGGGGGGGYSGGGGGTWTGGAEVGAGGGGSYNSGTNKSNSASNTGMGKLVLTYVGP